MRVNNEISGLRRARTAIPLILGVGLLLAVGGAQALPTNPDPCHTAPCTPWSQVAIAVLAPASDGHQHRNGQVLWDMAGQFKTYSVWDDRTYQYNVAADRPYRKPADNKDFGHGFITVANAPRYVFDASVPMWAQPLIIQVIAQWTGMVNGGGVNTNGVMIQTQIQFQQVAKAGEILIQFAATYPTGGGGTGNFPYDSDIDDYGNPMMPIPPIPGGAPQGGRSGVLAYWTPSTRVLTFNSQINWYQMMDPNPANGANQFDFYTTALHEWGHVLGLDHPTMPGAMSTMQPSQGRRFTPNGILLNIDPGSLDGAKDLYTVVVCPPPPAPDPKCPACTLGPTDPTACPVKP